MSIARRSTNVTAKLTGLDQPNRDGAYDRGSNVARPGADGGEQESLLAERCGLGNNLGERKVESAWPGKATGRDTVNTMISMCTDFLVGTNGTQGQSNVPVDNLTEQMVGDEYGKPKARWEQVIYRVCQVIGAVIFLFLILGVLGSGR